MTVDKFPEYDIYYTDPPWEQRMVKFFQTQLNKDTGKLVDNTIDDILIKMAKLSNKNKPVFIEYSIKGTSRVIDIFTKYGHKYHATTQARYDNDRPFHVITFNTDINIPKDIGMKELVMYCVKETKAKVVFDSFAGIGFTCKYVKKMGADYIGYELNPKRYNKMIQEYART